MFDSIVIGGGPAGLSAAIYLVRKKLKVLLLTPEFGGQAAKSSEIENYLGFETISGPELLSKFVGHIEALGVESKNETVEKIEVNEKVFKVKTDTEEYETKTVVIASGKTPRQLDVPGEKEFMGRGVSYCAICDGPLFRDKTVTVIGGGNSALDAAIEIEKYASLVNIVNLDEEFKGDEVRKDHVKQSKKITTFTKAEVTEITGDNVVTAIKYKDLNSGQMKEIKTDGIFVEIGWTPATGFVENLVELNPLKEIKIDLENNTNIKGIFAAGDVTDVKEKQIIIAAGEGAKAALNAWQYLVMNQML